MEVRSGLINNDKIMNPQTNEEEGLLVEARQHLSKAIDKLRVLIYLQEKS